MRVDVREGISTDGVPAIKHRAYLDGVLRPDAYMADDELGVIGVFKTDPPFQPGQQAVEWSRHIVVDRDAGEVVREELHGDVRIEVVE